MAHVIINPGSGPVTGASEAHAIANMQVWCDDHPWDDVRFERRAEHDEGDGRYHFVVWRESVPRGGRGIHITNSEHEVEMPGLPLEQVRYVQGEGQNIWHFPRLYVDGSSWVWCLSLLDDEEYWDPQP